MLTILVGEYEKEVSNFDKASHSTANTCSVSKENFCKIKVIIDIRKSLGDIVSSQQRIMTVSSSSLLMLLQLLYLDI